MDIIDNIIVCNQANAYTKSRTPGGYTEIVKKTLTWDGDMTNVNDGAENIFQAPTVKLSDEYQDLNCISGFTLKFSESLGGGEIKYNREYFDSVDIIDISGGLGCLRATFTIDALNIMIYAIPAGMPEEVIAEIGVNEGVYLDVQEKDFLFVCDVYFKFETIHPIDPKYLPGVCLPVVELTGCTSGETITDETLVATLTEILEQGTPAVVAKVQVENGVVLCFTLSLVIQNDIPFGWVGTAHDGLSWKTVQLSLDPAVYPTTSWMFNLSELT